VLSSLKPELDQKGIPLIGVVHETTGVEEFKPFLKGDIYLDDKVQYRNGSVPQITNLVPQAVIACISHMF
jgi:hypothetical protein